MVRVLRSAHFNGAPDPIYPIGGSCIVLVPGCLYGVPDRSMRSARCRARQWRVRASLSSSSNRLDLLVHTLGILSDEVPKPEEGYPLGRSRSAWLRWKRRPKR